MSAMGYGSEMIQCAAFDSRLVGIERSHDGCERLCLPHCVVLYQETPMILRHNLEHQEQNAQPACAEAIQRFFGGSPACNIKCHGDRLAGLDGKDDSLTPPEFAFFRISGVCRTRCQEMVRCCQMYLIRALSKKRLIQPFSKNKVRKRVLFGKSLNCAATAVTQVKFAGVACMDCVSWLNNPIGSIQSHWQAEWIEQNQAISLR